MYFGRITWQWFYLIILRSIIKTKKKNIINWDTWCTKEIQVVIIMVLFVGILMLIRLNHKMNISCYCNIEHEISLYILFKTLNRSIEWIMQGEANNDWNQIIVCNNATILEESCNSWYKKWYQNFILNFVKVNDDRICLSLITFTRTQTTIAYGAIFNC